MKALAWLLFCFISQGLTVRQDDSRGSQADKLHVKTFYPGVPLGLDVDVEGNVGEVVLGGQASRKGIHPGWRLLFVDDRRYSKQYLIEKAAGVTSTRTYDVTFSGSGLTGLMLEETGEVSGVYKGSEAERLGLKIGNKLTLINGKPYKSAFILTAANKKAPFNVTFDETLIAKPFAVTFADSSVEFPLAADSGKCMVEKKSWKCCCAQVCNDGTLPQHRLNNGTCAIKSELFAAHLTGHITRDNALATLSIPVRSCAKWNPFAQNYQLHLQGLEIRLRRKKCISLPRPEAYDCQPLCEAMF